MIIVGIDPGNIKSALIIWDPDNKKITHKMLSDNNDILLYLDNIEKKSFLAIEMIASYGMPVGKEVFETCDSELVRAQSDKREKRRLRREARKGRRA